MTDSHHKEEDELAGTEQPFVQHLMELRDRLLYSLAGLAVCMALLAFWPSPSGLIDLIALPIRAHMPPGAKLIAVGVFSPFFVPLKVLMMAGVLLALPWLMYRPLPPPMLPVLPPQLLPMPTLPASLLFQPH